MSSLQNWKKSQHCFFFPPEVLFLIFLFLSCETHFAASWGFVSVKLEVVQRVIRSEGAGGEDAAIQLAPEADVSLHQGLKDGADPEEFKAGWEVSEGRDSAPLP